MTVPSTFPLSRRAQVEEALEKLDQYAREFEGTTKEYWMYQISQLIIQLDSKLSNEYFRYS